MAEKEEALKKQVTKRIFSSYFGRFVHSSRNEDLKEEEILRSKRRADRKQKVRSLIVVDITSGNSNDTVGNTEDESKDKPRDINLRKESNITNDNYENSMNDDLGRITSTESCRESISVETLYTKDHGIGSQEKPDNMINVNYDSFEDQSRGEAIHQMNAEYDTKISIRSDEKQEQVVCTSIYEGIMQSNETIRGCSHPFLSLEQLIISSTSTKSKIKGIEQEQHYSRYLNDVLVELQNNQVTIHQAVEAVCKVKTQISDFDQFLNQLCDSNDDEIVELRKDQKVRNDEELRPSDDRKIYLKVRDHYFEDVDLLQFAKVFQERLTKGIDSIEKKLEMFNNKLDNQDSYNHLLSEYLQNTRNYCNDNKSKVWLDDKRNPKQGFCQNTFVPGKRQSDV